ncbi:DUF2079 domain-containing protein [Neoactinobaculum massilliense]|uniref:DUF2079 domain-containing protein n=1 Tax=Neoactinobaculum massilliense TaxID=2364794 RepID=UPI0019D0D3D4|nr:DUF2079 domain-containing protein [Neoactinobaculum massilliense]
MAATVLYVAFSLYQWGLYSAPSWDLGIFTQLLDRYAHFQAPIVNIKGPGFNLWGDHFHPLLAVLTPIFALAPSGLTLLITQDVLFGLSVVPIADYARRKLGTWPAVLIGAGAGLGWGLTSAVAAQFHEIALAVPLLAFGLMHLLDGHRRTAAVELGLLVFVKEDLGLTVAAIGGAAILEAWLRVGRRARGDTAGGSAFAGSTLAGSARSGSAHVSNNRVSNANASNTRAKNASTGHPAGNPVRSAWRRIVTALDSRLGIFGLRLILWGIVWFALTILVILPAFNVGGQWDYTGRLGSVAGQPEYGFFAPSEKLLTLVYLLAALGVVGLRSPLALALIPTMLWRFAGNVSAYWGIQWHYSAVLVPISALALVDGAMRTARALEARRLRRATRANAPASTAARVTQTAGAPSASGTGTPTTAAGGAGRAASSYRPHRAQAACASLAATVALVGAVVGTSQNTLGQWARGYSTTLSAEQRSAAGELLAKVGTGKSIAADIYLMAYLVPGNTVYWTGNSQGTRVVSAVAFGPQSLMSGDGAANWAATNYGGTWHVAYNDEGYVLVERD